jgi:hypothetical protein
MSAHKPGSSTGRWLQFLHHTRLLHYEHPKMHRAPSRPSNEAFLPFVGSAGCGFPFGLGRQRSKRGTGCQLAASAQTFRQSEAGHEQGVTILFDDLGGPEAACRGSASDVRALLKEHALGESGEVPGNLGAGGACDVRKDVCATPAGARQPQ